MKGTLTDAQALARVREIAGLLRDLEARAQESTSAEIELSLFERAAELADEAAGLLEQVGRRP